MIRHRPSESSDSVLRRVTSLGATVALVATGLVVTSLLAPAAEADISPVAASTSSTVTSDVLPTVQIDGVAWDQAVVGNTVYVGGQFSNARPAGASAGTNLTTRNNLLAYDITSGELITSFAPSLNAQVKAIAAAPDGSRVYVGGTFTTANGSNRYRIAAYDTATGALVKNFAPTIDATVNAIVVTDTAVYVGGIFSKAGGQARARLAAFSPTNGALLAWNPTADASVNALTVSPDGALIAGGTFQNVNGSAAYGMAKIDLISGALIPWNATKLIRNAGSAAAILSLSSDATNVYGTGYVYGAGGNLEGTFSADAASGDINWVEDCHGDTYGHYVADGVVYTVSHAHYCGNIGGFSQSDPWSINQRHALAFTNTATGTAAHDPYGYYDYYGTPTPSLINWFPDISAGTYTGKSQAAWTISGNSKYVVVGGEFPTVNGKAQQGLVRFAVAGTAPSKVGPTYSGANFLPSVTALPSGVARISWQANTDRDDLTLTYKLTRNNVVIYTTTDSSPFWSRPTMGYLDSTVVPGTTYSYRLSATDAAGNVAQSSVVSFTAPAAGSTNAYATRVLADGASVYWPMNEAAGSVLFDNSTSFNDADTGAGVTRGAVGAVGGDTATTFDGATSAGTRIAVAAPNTFTEQAWVRTTSTAGGKIVGFGSNASGLSGSYDRMVYMDNAGRIIFGVYPGSTAIVYSATGFNDGQWHQITASLGVDGMKLFIDGKLISSRTDVTTGQSYSGYWRVGGDNLGGWPSQPTSNYLAGSIDEVAIYPTVLSRQTINAQWVASGRSSTIPTAPADAYGAAVFNDNPLLFWRLGESSGLTATDSGQNGDQTGVYQGGVTLGAAGGIKGTTNTAATFDGSNDFVASSNAYANPTNYSEEAWFKTTSASGGKIIGFGSGQSGNSANYDRHVYLSTDGKVTFGTWTGVANTIVTPKALNDGVWHHVVATQSSTDGMKLYIDGSLVGTNAQTGAQAYSGYWRVGGDNHWGCCSAYLAATIDDAAVYSSVLTAAQVANHYKLGSSVVLPNVAPTADFSSAAVALDATFDASTSTDKDGSIAGYAWDFGDGATASGPTAAHSYGVAGNYTVTLVVTDDTGATATITRSVTVTAPANIAPTAAFTVTASQLTVSVDGSTSVDSDGSITSYAWDFGDGGTDLAVGASVSHTYLAGGTYPVTLTVTDNAGATTSTTQQVTVSAPVPTFLLNDTFARTISNGLGSADVGGSWTVAGGAANFAVGNGVGTIRLATAGAGPSATLGSVTAGNVDASFEVALDKVSTGGGTYVSVGARKVANSDYRAKVWFKADGTLQVQLVKVVNGTATTLKTVNVSGVSYTPGAKLNVRFQVTGTASVSLNAKVWTSGSAEPGSWQASVADSSSPLAAAGGFTLYPYLSGSSTGAVVASFDNLQVKALAG